MKLRTYTWWILAAVSLGVGFLGRTSLRPEYYISEAIGGAIGIIGFPLLIMGLVVLVGRLFRVSPSPATRRAVFFSFWALMLLSVLARVASTRPQEWRSIAITTCMNECREKGGDHLDSLMDVRKYCECAIAELQTRHKLDSTSMRQVQDRNSVLFNELYMTCLRPALRNPTSSLGSVFGVAEVDTIPLVEGYQGVTRVKVTIGGSTYYFIVDSGASDIMVSSALEEELKKSGAIHRYLTNMEYEMANGELIDCRRAVVTDIQIGDFLVDSTVVAFYDGDIQFLLGKSFLDHFSSWSMSQDHSALILAR